MRQQAGKIRDGQEPERIAEKPHAETVRRRGCNRSLREPPVMDQPCQQAQNGQARSRRHKCRLAAEQDAGNDDHQQIQRSEIAVLQSRCVNDPADHHPRRRTPANRLAT